MPYIFVTLRYPTHKAKEVVDMYVEHLKKYPHDRSLTKELILGAVTTDENGIDVLSVDLVKEGKLEEALTFTGKVCAMYQPIEGLEYKIRVRSTLIEAFDTLGMKMPGQ